MTAPLLLVRPASAPPESLREYRERGGYGALQQALSDNQPDALTASIEAAGLRGRGGAAFPTARKWQLAAANTSPEKYVVANGGEHEPGSDKDRHLAAKYPHSILEGLLLCGFATGATKGWLYLIEDMREQIAACEHALEELRDAGLLGASILGSETRSWSG